MADCIRHNFDKSRDNHVTVEIFIFAALRPRICLLRAIKLTLTTATTDYIRFLVIYSHAIPTMSVDQDLLTVVHAYGSGLNVTKPALILYKRSFHRDFQEVTTTILCCQNTSTSLVIFDVMGGSKAITINKAVTAQRT